LIKLKADTFNKGYVVTKLLAAATLDMAWHSVTKNLISNRLEFEKHLNTDY
jgi:peptidyl-dipeptidase Dcp